MTKAAPNSIGRSKRDDATPTSASVQPGNTTITIDDALPRSACDWSQLQQDSLVNIFSQLQVPDLVFSGAVCKSWRLSYLAVRRLRLCSLDQCPYLVYSSKDRDGNTATLHNLSTNKIYHVSSLPDPPFRSRYVLGSSYGWLVTADEESLLHLLNPVTGAQVALPPPHTIEGVTPSFDGDGVLSGYHFRYPGVEPGSIWDERFPPEFRSPKKTRSYLYERAVLSSGDPSAGNDCIVVLKHFPGMYLSYARVGDTRWTLLRLEHDRKYDDIMYNGSDGLFYAVACGGEIHMIDLNGTSPALLVRLLPDIDSMDLCTIRYIIRAPWGDLLQVLRLYGDPPSGSDPDEEEDEYQSNSNNLEHCQSNNLEQEKDWLDEHESEEDEEDYCPTKIRDRIKVCKVDLAKGEFTEISNLRDHAIFIGFNSIFMIHSGDYPNIRPNCVYVSDDYSEYIFSSPFIGRKMSCVSLEDDSLRDMSFSDSLLHWPPPVWFRPRLT